MTYGEYILSGIIWDTDNKNIKLPTTLRILIPDYFDSVETALEYRYGLPVKSIRIIRRVGELL